ncbi:MAG: hypothetical protein IJ632_00570 [Muribaculaceae bacterium]|nr:hypothetical protein [Muribaculaceae bacterium]
MNDLGGQRHEDMVSVVMRRKRTICQSPMFAATAPKHGVDDDDFTDCSSEAQSIPSSQAD